MGLEARYAVIFKNPQSQEWDDTQHYRKADLQHACNWAMALAAQMVREGDRIVTLRVVDQHSEQIVFETHTWAADQFQNCAEQG
jgi:hypothetical protein